MNARYPKIPSLVLSVHDEAIYAERALNAGALGYVTKQQLDETVLSAIRLVLAGETYMRDAAAASRRGIFARANPRDRLTRAHGDRPRIAGVPADWPGPHHASDRRVKTIESHLEHIKNKLGLLSAAELAPRATQWVETGRIG
jgi:DNA-binding NarL/FixJ family response regulator